MILSLLNRQFQLIFGYTHEQAMEIRQTEKYMWSFVRALRRRNAPKKTINDIKCHLRNLRLESAAILIQEATVLSPFEYDMDVVRPAAVSFLCLGELLRSLRQYNEAAKYTSWRDSLHENRMKYETELKEWHRQSNPEKIQQFQARKLACRLAMKTYKDSAEDRAKLVDDLSPHITLTSVEKGDVIYKRGTTSESVYFVAIGSIALYHSIHAFFPYKLLKSESQFGGWYLLGRNHLNVPRANCDSYILAIDKGSLETIFERHPDFHLLLVKDMFVQQKPIF